MQFCYHYGSTSELKTEDGIVYVHVPVHVMIKNTSALYTCTGIFCVYIHVHVYKQYMYVHLYHIIQ